MTIDEIQALDESAVKAMAEETLAIKGHTVYLVDLGGYFGYSALVFADGMHIYHANDYALHHAGKTKDELREWYVKRMESILFTEEELGRTSDDYDELHRKRNYLSNYYPMRRERQSIFCSGEDDIADWYKKAKQEGTAIYSNVGLSYYKQEDKPFVEHMADLWIALEKNNDPLRDYEHAKSAFKWEMFNHEYPINWQGDYDVIGCFANVKYKGDGTEIDQTDWSEEVKRAYYDAAKEVRREGNW